MRRFREVMESIRVGNQFISVGKVCSSEFPGTWVPLSEGRVLAERNHVLHKLRPLFDYIPGDISPPQAPKHATNKPKILKPAQLLKKQSVS